MNNNNPKVLMRFIYSCFDCYFFKNKISSSEIEKERYVCMIEKKEFSFSDMSKDGYPTWCPLPLLNSVKRLKITKKFEEFFNNIESEK